MPRILITGGAGFIGSNLVRFLLRRNYRVLNVDKLTYAGNLESLADVADHDLYSFSQTDIADAPAIDAVVREFAPQAILHLAAESHVDRSIDRPAAFVETNVVGTCNLLQAARAYWQRLDAEAADAFRFVHVSTDEVFGSLPADGYFTETAAYDPRSPYSASKAASDHLARAWYHTYGLPVLITNCSNNYGPYQFPEKLIPVVILKAVAGEPIPVYGQGQNVRDWLYVEDHCRALTTVLEAGIPGETYNIGGNNERTNLDLVRTLCGLLDELRPNPALGAHASLITYVADRPGHDLRYAIDATKIHDQLGWSPQEDLASGLRKTVRWYLENQSWWQSILSGDYHGQRLGILE